VGVREGDTVRLADGEREPDGEGVVEEEGDTVEVAEAEGDTEVVADAEGDALGDAEKLGVTE
jgi:hypothetical protein